MKITTGLKLRDINEEKRKRLVKRESHKLDCLSSDMNTCQALVNADCYKRKVMKSVGIQRALHNSLKDKSGATDISKYTIVGTYSFPTIFD